MVTFTFDIISKIFETTKNTGWSNVKCHVTNETHGLFYSHHYYFFGSNYMNVIFLFGKVMYGCILKLLAAESKMTTRTGNGVGI